MNEQGSSEERVACYRKTVPFATVSDEKRIVDRLMCDGYSIAEIESGFTLQAKSNGDFTVESVRKHIWLAK